MAFHLTLSSRDADPTSSKFRTKLPQMVDLKGEWSVGLHDLSFPQTHIAFDTEQILLLRVANIQGVPDDDPTLHKKGAQWHQSADHETLLQPGSYTTNDIADWIQLSARQYMQTLIDNATRNEAAYYLKEMSAECEAVEKYITVRKSQSNRLTIQPAYYTTGVGTTMNRFWIFPILSPRLAEICGYTKLQEILYDPDKLYKLCSPYATSMPLRCEPMQLYPKTLYVESDIVEPSMVGSRFMKVLRSLPYPASEESGTQVLANFPVPMMVRVVKKQFDTIEINIKDEHGKNLSFEEGYSTVTLWFVRHK